MARADTKSPWSDAFHRDSASARARALAASARNTWRALTSMGTALVLLFLLALAAIPGALLPQRSLNAAKVDEYLAEHTR